MTFKAALVYIRENEKGLLKDLYSHVDSQTVSKMELTGLIQRGQESDRQESWKVTKKGKINHHFASLYEEYKPSPIEKLQAFMNGLILNKKPLSV